MNAGGWGTTKFSAPIPGGVHAARQKHAPCVDMIPDRGANTTRDGYRVRLKREQAIVLGFMNFEDSTETYYVKYTRTGSYKANLHRETNILVYCNIVQPQIVGDVLLPLVGIVPYQKTSESYDETFYAVENIYYVPVQTKSFQNVKVHLRSSTEEFIPFEHGRATITLHVKPLNYFD